MLKTLIVVVMLIMLITMIVAVMLIMVYPGSLRQCQKSGQDSDADLALSHWSHYLTVAQKNRKIEYFFCKTEYFICKTEYFSRKTEYFFG